MATLTRKLWADLVTSRIMLEAYKYYPVESKRLLYLNISIDPKKIIYYYCYETKSRKNGHSR